MLAVSSLLAASYIVRLPASPPTACDYPTAAAAAASARALRHDARRIACVETETDDVLALKAELLDLLSEVQDRGVNGPPDLADDILEVATELDASEPSRYGARDASARPRGNGTRDLRGDDAAKTTVCAAIFEETTLQQWCCDLREETTPKKRAETVSTFATRPRVRRDL